MSSKLNYYAKGWKKQQENIVSRHTWDKSDSWTPLRAHPLTLMMDKSCETHSSALGGEFLSLASDQIRPPDILVVLYAMGGMGPAFPPKENKPLRRQP